MKKLWILTVILFLCACTGEDSQMARVLDLRQQLLECNSCRFDAEVTADFGDKTYTFAMQCQGNADGTLRFTVDEPDTISGISGSLSAKGGKIIFDEDRAVAFPMLAEGEVTPVSGPWLLYNTLRSGYILSCGAEGEQLRVSLNDSYEEEALQVEVWLDREDRPVMAEVIWRGRRVLTICVENFQIL